MLVIGSQALVHHIPNLDMSKTKDIDVICTADEMMAVIANNPLVKSFRPGGNGDHKWIAFFHNGNIVEFELAVPGNSAHQILLMSWQNDAYLINKDGSIGNACIAPVHLLYLIKMSHRFKKNTPHFLKTREHIKLIRDFYPSVEDIFNNPVYAELLRLREKESYNYAHPKLNVSKQEFFNPDVGVKYVFDHDQIHKIVSRGQQPAYTFFMKDGADVMCDKDKFFALDEQTRIRAVFEESTVLALERSQIPFKGRIDPLRSFTIALEKVCTSITSGWFREYAWENYEKALAMYQPDYVENFFNAEAEGRIKRLEQPVENAYN